MAIQLDRYKAAKQELIESISSNDPEHIKAATQALSAAVKAIVHAEYVVLN